MLKSLQIVVLIIIRILKIVIVSSYTIMRSLFQLH